jgi:hypothetical protein
MVTRQTAHEKNVWCYQQRAERTMHISQEAVPPVGCSGPPIMANTPSTQTALATACVEGLAAVQYKMTSPRFCYSRPTETPCKLLPQVRQLTWNSNSKPHRKNMVASAAARIWTPHLLGKAATTFPGTFASSSPAPNMPTTRGKRSCNCQTTNADTVICQTFKVSQRPLQLVR